MSSEPIVITPFTLEGAHVRLVPLQRQHAAALTTAGSEDRSTYDFTAVPATEPAMLAYIDAILDRHAAGEVLPFAQQRVADGALVGCTRYLDIKRWAGRPQPVEVEVGGTWLAASAQRTAINTEAKLLLFTHAFEVWNVHRVAVMTDARNDRSRQAIARAGGTFEGVLRHHRASYVAGEEGQPRNTASFSITDEDWPRVKASLTSRLRTGAPRSEGPR